MRRPWMPLRQNVTWTRQISPVLLSAELQAAMVSFHWFTSSLRQSIWRGQWSIKVLNALFFQGQYSAPLFKYVVIIFSHKSWWTFGWFQFSLRDKHCVLNKAGMCWAFWCIMAAMHHPDGCYTLVVVNRIPIHCEVFWVFVIIIIIIKYVIRVCVHPDLIEEWPLYPHCTKSIWSVYIFYDINHYEHTESEEK